MATGLDASRLRELVHDELSNYRSRLESRRERWFVLLLLSIIIIGSYIRFRRLGTAPFWIDEAYHAWAAKNFLAGEGFSDPIGSSSPYRRAWLTTSLPIALSFTVLGETEFAARLPMVLYGVGSIVVAYLLAARYGRLLGYLVAAFVAFDPFIVVWSREARMYAPLMFFYLASLYVTVRWYRDDELRFDSPAFWTLFVLVPLGIHTHKAYLGFGGVCGAFFVARTASSLLNSETYSIGDMDAKTRRLILITGTGMVGGVGYLLLQGVPAVLFAEPPETWPDRGPTYYWDLFGVAYPLLRYLVVPGALYAWIRNRDQSLIVLAIVLPLLVASFTPRKAPRFVYHVLPLVGLLGLRPVADGLMKAWEAITKDEEKIGFSTRVVSYGAPMLIVLVVASPLGGLAVADATYNPPYHPERSDWSKASEYVADRMDDEDIIVSTRPEMTMWYLGSTDYFFRQNGVTLGDFRDGRFVHTRTGAVYLNDTMKIKQLLAGDQDVWIIAGKKFYGSFTEPDARALVQKRTSKVGNDSWTNIEVYLYKANESQ